MPTPSVVDLDRELAPLLSLVATAATTAETERRPSREVMVALGQADLLHLLVPRDYGGREVTLRAILEFTERLARVHGSLAWTAMTCNEEAGIASAYLEPDSMRQFFGDHPTVVIAGSGTPKGRATRVDGGWSVNGRWPFVSGCTASDWIVLANLVEGSDPVRICFVLVPTADAVIEDTWHTVGLRGTGSNDVVLEEHFVAEQLAGEMANRALPRPDTPFYRLPSGLRFPFPKVGVAAGIARAAIDEFTELAEGKRPLYARSQLRQRPTAQAAVAEAEALLGSGRAWALEMADELWETAIAGQPVSGELHARCRLSCSHSVSSCISAVEGLAAEAGTTANFVETGLARHLADVRAVAAHFMVAPYQRQTAGRVLLGLDSEDSSF